DAQERPAPFAEILDRQAEHGREYQQRIDDDVRVAVGPRELGVGVERIEVERHGGEERVVTVIDGPAPVMLETPADLEVLVTMPLRPQDGAVRELRHVWCRSGGRAQE